jgi:acyl dehydratase/putative sterol carrier protein
MSDSYINPDVVLNSPPVNLPVSYNRRDVILYALGVGAKEPRFLYEGDQDFCVIPTFSTVFPFRGESNDIVPFSGSLAKIPGAKFNPAMILHGEQETEVLKHPIPVEGLFTNTSKVIGCYDKGKGAVVVTEALTLDRNTKTPIFRNVTTLFIRGLGGFGGDRGPTMPPIQLPNRKPDAIHADKTSEQQAFLYRLSGDYNPLHADPALAQMVGFQKPILHGLCTYGFACRAVLANFCDNDPKKFKLIKARFASPVYPGETLVTEMWREGTRVLFVTKVQERNEVVINNSYVELNVDNNKVPRPSPSSNPNADVSVKSAPVFDAMHRAIQNNPSLIQKVNAVFQFNLKTADGTLVTYTVDVKNGKGGVSRGVPSTVKPDVTITISDDDYFDIATGKLSSQQAFIQGKMKVSGNVMLAQKIREIQQASKM